MDDFPPRPSEEGKSRDDHQACFVVMARLAVADILEASPEEWNNKVQGRRAGEVIEWKRGRVGILPIFLFFLNTSCGAVMNWLWDPKSISPAHELQNFPEWPEICRGFF